MSCPWQKWFWLLIHSEHYAVPQRVLGLPYKPREEAEKPQLLFLRSTGFLLPHLRRLSSQHLLGWMSVSPTSPDIPLCLWLPSWAGDALEILPPSRSVNLGFGDKLELHTFSFTGNSVGCKSRMITWHRLVTHSCTVCQDRAVFGGKANPNTGGCSRL